MSQQMQTIPVSIQVQQLTAQLNQALHEKLTIDERAKQLETTIRDLRNILGGVGLGQQLQQEIASAKPEAPEQ